MRKTNRVEISEGATLIFSGADYSFLGDVIAQSVRLVSEGKIPTEVVEEHDGFYALCLLGKAQEVRVLTPGTVVTIGRATSQNASDWSFPNDSSLSKAHFRLTIDQEGHGQLEDLDSKNGTFVNDRRIGGRLELARGDCIRVGHSQFLFL